MTLHHVTIHYITSHHVCINVYIQTFRYYGITNSKWANHLENHGQKHHLLGSTSNWMAVQTREAPARSHPMRFGELGLKTLRRCLAGWLDGVLSRSVAIFLIRGSRPIVDIMFWRVSCLTYTSISSHMYEVEPVCNG